MRSRLLRPAARSRSRRALITCEPLEQRIRAEYRDMPGLSLTFSQAQRLWHVDPRTCHTVLTALTDQGFLHRTRDGVFVLRSPRIKGHRWRTHEHFG
jgi:hypothetical protein